MQILLSRSPSGPDRTGKQEQEQISPNHVQAFFPSSVQCSGNPHIYGVFRCMVSNWLVQLSNQFINGQNMHVKLKCFYGQIVQPKTKLTICSSWCLVRLYQTTQPRKFPYILPSPLLSHYCDPGYPILPSFLPSFFPSRVAAESEGDPKAENITRTHASSQGATISR